MPQTVSAYVGWVIVGVGAGGFVAVGGDVLPVAGGTIGVIVENGSGEDELSSTSTSSSSPSPSPTHYNIYPRRGSTSSQQTTFTRNLERIAQAGSVRRITGDQDRLLLWVASLTPDQASALRRNSIVQGLNVDGSLPFDLETVGSASATPPSPRCPSESCSHQRRDGTIVMQRDAHDDLKIFSQARGAPLPVLPGYAYDSRAGDRITVYVIDTGVDQNHPEFQNMRRGGRIRWLFLPGEPNGPEEERDDVGHGTCVISKVASPTFGVAKSVNIVVVKLSPIGGRIRTSRTIAALGTVARDIAQENLQGVAVVRMAMGIDPNRLFDNDRMAYIQAVRDLMELDAVLVVASGNIGGDNPGFALSTYPAILGSQFPIVVVGAVEASGAHSHYSQGMAAELTVAAPGTVSCAGQGGSGQAQGTSFAAPAVAGLAAYLMSLDQYRARIQVPGSVATNVRDLIKSLAYARLPLQPAVVWNGIDSRHPCPGAARQDAGSPGCPALNNTQPAVPSHRTQNGPKSKTMVTPSSNPLPVSSSTTDSSFTTGSSSMITPTAQHSSMTTHRTQNGPKSRTTLTPSSNHLPVSSSTTDSSFTTGSSSMITPTAQHSSMTTHRTQNGSKCRTMLTPSSNHLPVSSSTTDLSFTAGSSSMITPTAQHSSMTTHRS